MSAPLVALGTVVSRTTVTAAVLTAVVAFVVVMAASLGASWEAGRNATILAFVLAACVTAPNSQVDDRIAGWVVGSALAGFAAVALWPSTERHRVRRACATVLARAGAALTADGDERAVALGTLDDAVAALRALTGVRYRPLGTATADRALKLTVIESERLARLVHTTHERLPHPDPDERALVAASVATLHGIADRLVTFNARRRATPPPIHQLATRWRSTRCIGPGAPTWTRSKPGPAPRPPPVTPPARSPRSTATSRSGASRS